MMTFGGDVSTQLKPFNDENIAQINYTDYLTASNSDIFDPASFTAISTALKSLKTLAVVTAFNDTTSPGIVADFNAKIDGLLNLTTYLNTTVAGQIQNQTNNVVTYTNQLPGLGTAAQVKWSCNIHAS